ncbi:MAG TPA: DUF808 domain-containing protein [Sphingomonas sp.]|jgi:hypothetical protein|uniref:DUF808 domain-containing protein n=1 Tax=Sphingomonas sp. TaxID=28214 RepID=UPI002ED886A3
MPSGLVALLDDIAGLTKLAAASLDDIGAAAGKAGSKAIGVVVDDTAVTPRYVVGLSPKRELPIIWRIAKGSLRNKLLILLPAALLLSAFAPWAVTPLLMLGGAFLCFEGAEKVLEAFGGGHHDVTEDLALDSTELENTKVAGAIRTDFILSAEIMAIALADVATSPILTQAIVLTVVAIGITAGVYGLVGLIVKADDIGLHLSTRGPGAVRAFGRGLVLGVPKMMSLLSVVGTAAMIWVGGQILVHGLAGLGFAGPEHVIDGWAETVRNAAPFAGGFFGWFVKTLADGILGLIVGAIIAGAIHFVRPNKHDAKH